MGACGGNNKKDFSAIAKGRATMSKPGPAVYGRWAMFQAFMFGIYFSAALFVIWVLQQ